jgi:glutamate decarboxylase
MPTFALSFSRPGGQIVAQYYNFLRLGKKGYRKIHTACYETAQYLAAELGKLGPFQILFDGNPNNGIPAVSWTVKAGFDTHGYTLFDLSDRLRMRGWQVAAYTMPPKRKDLVVQRILVRHGFSKDLASLFVDDMQRSLQFFSEHPVAQPMTEGEAGGFLH